MTPISTLMRESSMADHQAAESVHFVTHLMRGELSAAHYTEYLCQLAHVYKALERLLPPGTELPFHEGLKRFDAIERDLENLGVSDLSLRPLLPATVDYVARLQEITSISDVRLIAHHYTRYLGDLSGGQAIGALMQRHYGLCADQVSFYDFSNLGDPVPIKRAYREALDELELCDDELKVLVDEVRIAFRLNTELFVQLGQLELV